MMKKDWSSYGVIALLPFLFVVMVYGIEAFARNSFFVCNGRACDSIPASIWNVLRVDTDGDQPSAADPAENNEARKVIALRYSGRMNWYFIAEIFLYVSIAALGIAAFITSQLSPAPRILSVLAVIAFASVVGLFFYNHPEIHMAIFQTIFKEAISVDVPEIAQITNILNSLGNAAVFSLLIAICATLLPFQDESLQGGMKALSTRMKYLRIILYTGTALLVTAILLKKSIYQWTLAYTPQDDALETASNFVTSLLTLEGGFYTLVLAAAYFPAALVLQRRAQLMVGPSLDDAEQETKLKEYGFNFSLKETLPRILAILGPFLTGPVADLLTGKFF